ncbi:F-box protein CPR30-like [Chenopodium quinoa]|uniref:F-box protein CPR30-like n=1 Tax=Chenopodium quinoa TaxID=63459 RepID=UPI000B76D1D4|nr:F-box protein CPR30-like [Chenopodium quinoa]
MAASSSENDAPSPIEDLPTEILSQILLRLPNIKSLLRAKLVCKSWFTLISSSEFTHVYNLRANNSLLVYPNFDLNSKLSLYAAEVNGNDFSKAEKIQLPPYLYDELGLIMIVASCNDLLLCIFGSDSTLILLNPLTRLYHVIPRFDFYDNFLIYGLGYGVGYDHINDDYKVVIFGSDSWTTANAGVFLYSLRDESWHRICYSNNQEISTLSGYFCPTIRMISGNLKPAVVTNCLLHFVYDCKKIVSFNVCNENWSEIPAPGVEGYIQDIGVLDGSLSVLEGKDSQDSVSSPGIKLWVMKEYGVKESWVLLLSVSDLYPIRSSLTSVPLAISSDKNEILLHLKHNRRTFSYVWYNLKENNTRKAQIGPLQEYVSIKSTFPVTDMNKFNKKNKVHNVISNI